MARKKRNTYRKSHKYVYFIVEGCTEENYIKVLNLLYKQGVRIKNCNGGSAKKVLEEAKKIIKKHGDEYIGYVIWFDLDTYNKSREYNILNSLKAKDNVEIYISKPCRENLLLAHFQKININESQCDRCLRNLKKYIARYEKNDCDMLTKFINEAQIKTAVTNYQDLRGIPKVVKNNQLLKYQQ